MTEERRMIGLVVPVEIAAAHVPVVDHIVLADRIAGCYHHV